VETAYCDLIKKQVQEIKEFKLRVKAKLQKSDFMRN
jgi:hypothetical protein